MALPDFLKDAAAEARISEVDRAADAAIGATEEQDRQDEIMAPVHRLVAMATEIATAAIDKDVPIDLYKVDRRFRDGRARSRVPLMRDRKDVHKHTEKDDPAGGRTVESKRIKRSVIQRGELVDQSHYPCWDILFSTASRTRNIGVLLTEGGRLGIYDVPDQLGRLDPTDTTSPHEVVLDSSIYAGQVPQAEEGIFFLDTATYPLPAFLEKISLYGKDGTHRGGLAAIETALINFIVENDLDT